MTDNHYLTVESREVIPAHQLFKTYNFFGWFESPHGSVPSPEFTFSVNIYDACAAFYEMNWSVFTDINLMIGSVSSATSQIATFTQTLRSHKNFDPKLDCGPGDFEVSVNHPESSTNS